MKREVEKLRAKMAEAGIDAYIVPTTDYHGSEYVNDYFKCREYISGFTGSAGTLLVTASGAFLWTDGRYFIQAEAQLKGSGIELMKMNEPDVPEIGEYIKHCLSPGDVLGFDGRVMDIAFAREMEERFRIVYDVDLVGEIWPERPEIIPSEVYRLPDEVTGEDYNSKLSRVRNALKKENADYNLITRLEDIAWLFNLRGEDIKYTPVFFAFALIGTEEARLYLMDKTFDGIVLEGVEIKDYDEIGRDLEALKSGRILIDKDVVSYALVRAINDSMDIVYGKNPCELMKAVKNSSEIRATREAHKKDGAAMAEFLCRLKSETGRGRRLSELSAAECLRQCRSRQKGFKDLSFETIAGYESNGAIVHYSASETTDKSLKAEGFLLVDSGGQYEDGTTDITRTIALGPVNEKMKADYTAVLKGHINLALAVFDDKTTGAELDRIAREPLAEAGLSYNHGTGHGIGHLLAVHEGPQLISPRGGDSTFLPGMITSNEPGVYIEGRYGIRLENEVLCVEKEKGRYAFETITLCPFDRDAINADMLTDRELEWLNNYHRHVYNEISHRVDGLTEAWLAEATAPVGSMTE